VRLEGAGIGFTFQSMFNADSFSVKEQYRLTFCYFVFHQFPFFVWFRFESRFIGRLRDPDPVVRCAAVLRLGILSRRRLVKNQSIVCVGNIVLALLCAADISRIASYRYRYRRPYREYGVAKPWHFCISSHFARERKHLAAAADDDDAYVNGKQIFC
jgi:hypothetical protein